MVPLIIHLVGFGLLFGLKQLGFHWGFLARAGSIAIGVMFVATGVAHFLRAEPMVQMIPPSIPMRHLLVYASGVFEVVAGVCLIGGFGPQRLIGYALMVFLVMALPLNVYSALSGSGLGANGPGYLWFRVPLQVFWLWWIWFFVVKS